MTITELYNIAHDIPEQLQFENKYTWLGFKKIIEVKYLDVNDTMTHNIPISSYIQTYGAVLLFPNRVNGIIVDLYIRGLKNKEHPLQLGSKGFPYNLGLLNPNFTYGDPIILVEGIGDLGGIKLVNSDLNVVAMRSNSPSVEQFEIISNVTNNVILIPDADKAGTGTSKKVVREFGKLGVTVKVVPQYGDLKDSGEIVDMATVYIQTPSKSLEDKLELIYLYYNSILNT